MNQEEKTDHINKKLNMLSIHKELSKLDLNKTKMDFDATSSYPSAMWDKNSLYPKIETGYAFQPHMNDVFVNDFNIETFNQDSNESAIIILKQNNPTNFIFHYLPVKEKIKR